MRKILKQTVKLTEYSSISYRHTIYSYFCQYFASGDKVIESQIGIYAASV